MVAQILSLLLVEVFLSLLFEGLVLGDQLEGLLDAEIEICQNVPNKVVEDLGVHDLGLLGGLNSRLMVPQLQKELDDSAPESELGVVHVLLPGELHIGVVAEKTPNESGLVPTILHKVVERQGGFHLHVEAELLHYLIFIMGVRKEVGGRQHVLDEVEEVEDVVLGNYLRIVLLYAVIHLVEFAHTGEILGRHILQKITNLNVHRSPEPNPTQK